jgi:hypothetical protein
MRIAVLTVNEVGAANSDKAGIEAIHGALQKRDRRVITQASIVEKKPKHLLPTLPCK